MSERERNRLSENKPETEKSEQNKNVCPECSGKLIYDESHGETQCDECGLIVDENRIDHGPEWRNFNDNGDNTGNSRVGSPLTEMMHDKGLSTQIDWRNRDASGQSISAKQRKKMKRLRTWNERASSQGSKDRNLKQALGEIDRMASSLGLPKNVRETASVIYRKCLQEDLLIGRSIEGVATAALYASARKVNVPRSFDQFSKVSRVERIEIERTYQYICRQLNLEIPPADPSYYIPQFASELNLDDTIEHGAMEIVEASRGKATISGKNPVGIAAAAIYAAGLIHDSGLTQREVSEVSDISVVTIRNRYNELLKEYNKQRILD